MRHLMETEKDRVPAAVLREGERMRWYVTEHLGVNPTLRWYSEAREDIVGLVKIANKLAVWAGGDVKLALSDPSADHMLGFYSEKVPEIVWVDSEQSPTDAARIVAHEMRHRWQDQRGWMQSMDRDGLEADADAYAEKAISEYAAWCDAQEAEARRKYGTDPKRLMVEAANRIVRITDKLIRESTA